MEQRSGRPATGVSGALVSGLGGAALALLLALSCAMAARADDPANTAADVDPRSQTAEDVLRATTDRILAVIEEARSYVDENPERYYAAVQKVLDPVVDFRGFARGVMGDYATTERYRNLDEAGREKLRGQLERFSETMRRGLVRTYSKGLLAFGGSRVEIPDSNEGQVGDDRATLRQLIYSDTGQPYVVIYQMARDRDGRWLMRNLIVENVNLGQIYRNQFEDAARRFKGDLDAVIENWSADTLDDA
ncbi:MAG: ABC transporter substrate-binding protein [Halieaceae bacterium]|nr:ABC transporter substrate-binding protein [Halieaceae bacterium]